MVHASLCTGIGACEFAAQWLGWENAFSCEINEFCNKALKYHYSDSKHYEDIYKTDFSEWRGEIDVLTAGFPCQPFSCAGERKGAEDDRYLWPEVLRAIEEIRPTWFIGENVDGITSMVLPGDEIEVGSYKDVFGESYQETEMHFVIDRICNDLEGIGYSVQPIIIPACSIGAPHKRYRIWFIAENTKRIRCDCKKSKKESDIRGFRKSCTRNNERICDKQRFFTNSNSKLLANSNNKRKRGRDKQKIKFESSNGADCWKKFPTQSFVCGGDDGIPDRLSDITVSRWITEATKAFGNSMVPQVVLEIFKSIQEIEK